MTKFTNPQTLRKVGLPTPQTVIYKSESHKLHQAFPVAEGETIVAGQPVYLKNDGTVKGFEAGLPFLGIAVTNSETPAYPAGAAGVEITVMVEGYAICYGVANAAIAKAGYVIPVTVSPVSQEGYVKYATSNEATNFIAINSAEEGDLIQVIIR